MFLSYRRGDSHEVGITKCSFSTVEGSIWSGKYKMNVLFLQERRYEAGNAKRMYFLYRRWQLWTGKWTMNVFLSKGWYGVGNGQWMFSYVKGDMEWEMQNECSFLSTIFSSSTPTLKSLTKTKQNKQTKKTRRRRRWKRQNNQEKEREKKRKKKERKQTEK